MIAGESACQLHNAAVVIYFLTDDRVIIVGRNEELAAVYLHPFLGQKAFSRARIDDAQRGRRLTLIDADSGKSHYIYGDRGIAAAAYDIGVAGQGQIAAGPDGVFIAARAVICHGQPAVAAHGQRIQGCDYAARSAGHGIVRPYLAGADQRQCDVVGLGLKQTGLRAGYQRKTVDDKTGCLLVGDDREVGRHRAVICAADRKIAAAYGQHLCIGVIDPARAAARAYIDAADRDADRLELDAYDLVLSDI